MPMDQTSQPHATLVSPIPLANAPFDDNRADLTLRTSDGVHFRIFKIILSLASPIFADMFSIPQPTSGGVDDVPTVVTVSEDSKALDLSLRHLYPVSSPTRVELREARTLAEFARKYQVDALESIIARYLTDAIEDDPVGVYAIAVTYGLKDIGAKAARATLKLPISRLRPPQVQYITAELYGELIQYHIACGKAASAVTSARKWFPSWEGRGRLISTGASPNLDCSLCTTRDFISGPVDQTSAPSRILHRARLGYDPTPAIVTRYGPRCLWNYLYRSASVLAHHPTAEAVTTKDFVQKSFDCAKCSFGTRGDMLEFSQIFGTEIENVIERVPPPEAVQPGGPSGNACNAVA